METGTGSVHLPKLFGALSVHAVMLQILNVPFPDLSVVAPVYKLAIRVMATLGLVIFWQLASQNLRGSFVTVGG
jgi:hypothetical protein